MILFILFFWNLRLFFQRNAVCVPLNVQPTHLGNVLNPFLSNSGAELAALNKKWEIPIFEPTKCSFIYYLNYKKISKSKFIFIYVPRGCILRRVSKNSTRYGLHKLTYQLELIMVRKKKSCTNFF